MNTISSLFAWIGNVIGANPNTMTTSSKTVVGAVNEIAGTVSDIGNRAHIVDSGESGIWTYRKWSDGTAECWGRGAFNSSLVSWGYVYSTGGYGEFAYPSGLFESVPSCHITPLQSAAGDGWLTIGSQGSKDKTPKVGWNRATNAGGTITFSFDIYAIGKWK